MKDREAERVAAGRGCTCHYDERPHPCQRRYALTECWIGHLVNPRTILKGAEDARE